MKKHVFLLICFCALQVNAQIFDNDRTDENTIGDLTLSPICSQIVLPESVDNSQNVFMRPVFNQLHNSCAQASGIAYVFTYEINRLRNLDSSLEENWYPTHYTYTMLNNGTLGVSSITDGWSIVKENGCPDFTTWGGMDGSLIQWMNGYNNYINAMKNRIESYYAIPVYTPENLEILKYWLNNHNANEETGGLASFSTYLGGFVIDHINEGPYIGKAVLADFPEYNNSFFHSMTVVGYDDNFEYDLDGMNGCTNNLDINQDGEINMLDWEIGALKIVNSKGLDWPMEGDSGYAYLPYRLLGKTFTSPQQLNVIDNRRVYVLNAIAEYQPQIAIKANVSFQERDKLTYRIGYSELASASEPTVQTEMSYLDNQGGPWPLFTTNGESTPLEVGIDFGYFFGQATFGKIFLQVDVQNSTLEGIIHSYSVTDYRWDEAFTMNYDQTDIQIDQNYDAPLAIEYHLLPHGKEGKSVTTHQFFQDNRISRFNTNITNGGSIISNGYDIDMYDSKIYIDEWSSMVLNGNTKLTSRSGVCRLIVDGDLEIYDSVQFIAESGTRLEIIINGNSTVFNGIKFLAEEDGIIDLKFANTQKDYILTNCHLSGCNIDIASQSLVMNCTDVKSTSSNRIKVNNGSTLEIGNNTILTSKGTNIWNGVNVKGNYYLPQSGYRSQGTVKIYNSTIENALCGIKTWIPPIPLPDKKDFLLHYENYSGGVIIAENSIFRNNVIGIEFLPYEYPNLSLINNCTFETTRILNENYFPEAFIKLIGVNEIPIIACNFFNTSTNTQVHNKGTGVYAFNSSVLVDRSIDRKSTFDGLYRGIYCLGTENQRSFKVSNSIFQNTYRSLYICAVNDAIITSNYFSAFNDFIGSNSEAYGAYLDRCSYFMIEENVFENCMQQREGIGLIINDAGPDFNEVYKNTFKKLYEAAIAQGHNRFGSSGTGLCFKCNSFYNNEFDLKILPRNPGWPTTKDGIRTHQGKNSNYPDSPAGNKFTTEKNTSDIRNACNPIIYYYHSSGADNLVPDPSSLTTIQTVSVAYSEELSCPSRLLNTSNDCIGKHLLASESENDSSKEMSFAIAKNILIHNNLIEYNEPIFHDEYKSSDLIKECIIDKHFELLIYPNPCSKYCNIEVKSGYPEIKLDLINTEGKILFTRIMNHDIFLDLSSYKAGVYFVKIETADEIIVRKLMVY